MISNISITQNQFLQTKASSEKKELGQFFTPSEIATFMASLITLDKDKSQSISVLDAGAGAGILGISALLKLKELGFKKLHLTAYEKDDLVIPLLEENLDTFLKENEEVSFSYEVINQDFILEKNNQTYDVCCINPPYFKYSVKTSPYAKSMAHLFKGDPNIYALFVAKALSLLAPQGELIFITPRSFTNGLYFKGFRKYLLKNNSLKAIHIFKSRKDAFEESDVLQENVIFKIVKDLQQSNIRVSSSNGVDDLNKSEINDYDSDLLLDSTSSESFIRIPESQEDAEVLSLVESWGNTFDEMGYFISTGPVVEYRSKEFLEPTQTDSLPLINAHNLQDLKVVFDGSHKKDKRFYLIEGASKWLVPNKNYVLIRRISSKDEKKRIGASVYEASNFKQDFVALENHINFIGHKERDMTLEETYGLALILRSNLFDTYFRTISGNTQVNATEIKTLKFCSKEVIEELGLDWLAGKIDEDQTDEFLKDRIKYESRYTV
jgi:adenine-specific DNA-methyltransferase